MPKIQIEPNCWLHYEDDCFADPWRPAETVLLIHGGCESSAAWFAWVPHLSRNFRVIRVDLRGHGQSTLPSAEYQWSPSGLARDVHLFLNKLGIDSVHIVAAKIGGTVALCFAAEYPEQTRTVSAIGTPLHMREAGTTLPMSSISSWVSIGMDPYVRENLKDRLGSQIPPAQKEWWEVLMRQCDARALAGVAAFADTLDMREILPRINAPVLLLTNKQNKLVSSEAIEGWRSKIRNAQLIILPVDGFHIAASHPDECAAHVKKFLFSYAGS